MPSYIPTCERCVFFSTSKEIVFYVWHWFALVIVQASFFICFLYFGGGKIRSDFSTLTPFGKVQDRTVVTIARAEVSKVEDLQEKQLPNGETCPQYSVILSPVDSCNSLLVHTSLDSDSSGWRSLFFFKRPFDTLQCSASMLVVGILTLLVFQSDSVAVSVFFFYFHPGWYSSITFLMPRPSTLCESYGLLGPMAPLCDGLCGTTSHSNMATSSCTLVQRTHFRLDNGMMIGVQKLPDVDKVTNLAQIVKWFGYVMFC